MTTTVTTAASGPMTASGTTALPFTFQALSTTEILVTRNGVEAPLGTYSVSLNDDGTGSIIPLTDWETDEVYIRSNPNHQQTTEFLRFGAFYPDLLNKPLDRMARTLIALNSTVSELTLGTIDVLARADIAVLSGEVSGISDQLALKADLVGGLVPTSQLPAFDTTGYRGVVASQAAMLATTASLGNYVIRSDTDPDTVWYLTGSPSTSLASWTQTGAAASVSTVNGQTGTVVLGKADVGLGNVPNLAAADLPVSTAQQTALDAKASSASVALKADKTAVVKTAIEYGAIGDGVTNDYANLLTALQSGFVIDGLDKTYLISQQLLPTSFKGFRNATLRWNSVANMQVQNRALLYVQNLDDWEVDRLKFDMGTVENIGATGAPDNARAGFKTTNTGTSDNCRITNLEVYGSGAGTGLELRNLKNAVIMGNYVHDRIVSDVGITNDAQNGIQLDNVFDSVLVGNTIARLYLRVGAALNKKWARGILLTSCQNVAVTGNNGSFVDQCFDFSGGSTPQPNRGITVSGNSVSDVFTYGFKFANVSRDFVISGNTVRRYGFAGFTWSGNGAEGANQTQNHLCVGNYAHDFTGEYNGVGHGFWVQAGGAGYPRNIRIESCGAYGVVGGNLLTGFTNGATLGNPLYPNTIENCHSGGQSGLIHSGFHERRAKVSYTQNVTSGAGQLATFPTPAAVDNTMGYWSSGAPTRFTVQEAGVYRIIARAVFAANSTGFRAIGISVGGGSIGGDATNAVAGTATTLSFVSEHTLAVGGYFTMSLEQNSGSTLSTDVYFNVEYVRPA